MQRLTVLTLALLLRLLRACTPHPFPTSFHPSLLACLALRHPSSHPRPPRPAPAVAQARVPPPPLAANARFGVRFRRTACADSAPP